MSFTHSVSHIDDDSKHELHVYMYIMHISMFNNTNSLQIQIRLPTGKSADIMKRCLKFVHIVFKESRCSRNKSGEEVVAETNKLKDAVQKWKIMIMFHIIVIV